MRTTARVRGVSDRAHAWVDHREPGSRSATAIDVWRRYREVDGPLQSALLSLYVVVAIVPALLVTEEFFDSNPAALGHHIAHHYHLNGAAATLVQSVLASNKEHELGSGLFAIVGALVFGVGFGRVLQVVHSRAWRVRIDAGIIDQILFGGILVALYGLIVLLLFQLNDLKSPPLWLEIPLSLGWIVVLVLFFDLAPWLLLHKQVSARDLMPGAVLTAIGLVVLMVISSFVMPLWVDLYARDYGGLGVVLAMYFWLAFSSATIVMAASISPALAARRAARSA
jgi:membrane protein